jgi:hypothetical protein
MKFRAIFVCFLGTCLAGTLSAQTNAPVLKWQRGGCGSFCQTGWYGSPAVADLDGDGQAEVIWASYDLVAVNGANGSLKWRSPNPNRSWPGVVVADLTGDGTLEVVVGRGSNQLVVHDRFGNVLWTRNPFADGEIRTLAVDDLDGDGKLEIVVGRASGGDTRQLSVYDAAGNVRPGWPARHDGEAGYGWGMYNENVTVGDLDGDGKSEIIGPTDTHYITALNRDGGQLPANPMYGAGKVWSQVGVHVSHAVDLRGYANCGTEHRPNFANSAPIIADMNGDGTREIVVIGDVYDCAIGDDADGDLYHMPWIFNVDRTRFNGSGYDWTVLPTPPPASRPLSEDYNVIENDVQNAVAADLDGDGKKEILFPSYDGRLHAYWLDKREHGNWPFVVPGTGIRFASEPVVADLDNDGRAEVIFTSWPEKGAGRVGQLHVLDAQGNALYNVNLPAPPSGVTWNGGLGAPTLANIDADPDLEVVVGTAATGLVAYDLPGTAAARVLWGTGRGNMRRTGVAPETDPVRPQAVWHPFFAVNTLETPYVGDFNGDGRTDIVTFTRQNPSAIGDVYVSLSTGSAFAASTKWHDFFAISTDETVVVGDYDGDGKDDIATWLGVTTRQVYMARSLGTSMMPAALWLSSIGRDASDVIESGDVNGDGRADLVDFARKEGKVYVALSTGVGFLPPTVWHGFFAVSTYERPHVADVSGDGRADIVTFATDSPTAFGDVYVAVSNSAAFVSVGGQPNSSTKWHDFFAIRPTEQVSIGDLNADSRDDFFTFLPLPWGQAYTANSLGTSMAASVLWREQVIYRLTDHPFTGDVNGDGHADVIVFAQGEGKVYVSLAP